MAAGKRAVSADRQDGRVVRQLSEAPPSADAADRVAPPARSSADRAAPTAIPVIPDTPVVSPAAGRVGAERRPARAQIAQVLRAKVQPPPLRTSTLSRQRLLDRLAVATQNRLTLVTADAGYGKTTLLADFSRRFDGACLWYSLDG